MALFSYPDIQEALNIDLTDPNGQMLATSLISAAVGYIETVIGYPLEEREVGEFFDGLSNRLWLSTRAPVSNVTIATYNDSTQTFEAIDSSLVRYQGNEAYTTASLPSGFQSVRVTYTTGWTAETLPADLRRALIDMVGLKLQEVTNYASNPDDPTGDGSGASVGALKRVSAGGYTEEYTTGGQSETLWKAKAEQLSRSIGSTLPEGIEEVVARYRVPFVL